MKADLIVMGTHGRSGLDRWVLGSVAERVLRDAETPVLTVRGTRPGSGEPAIRNILCPVNNTSAARESLIFASRLAACLGATLTALHVKEDHRVEPVPDVCRWIAAQPAPRCEVREELREGDAASEILSAAAESGCDLLVMAATHKLFFDATVLGTTTAKVVRHARCPVVTVAGRKTSATDGPAAQSA